MRIIYSLLYIFLKNVRAQKHSNVFYFKYNKYIYLRKYLIHSGISSEITITLILTFAARVMTDLLYSHIVFQKHLNLLIDFNILFKYLNNTSIFIFYKKRTLIH